jgi:hypothetical protein
MLRAPCVSCQLEIEAMPTVYVVIVTRMNTAAKPERLVLRHKNAATVVTSPAASSPNIWMPTRSEYIPGMAAIKNAV